MTFYNSLLGDSRRILDSATNGNFADIAVDDAKETIERMATHSLQYTQSSYQPVAAVGTETLFQ